MPYEISDRMLSRLRTMGLRWRADVSLGMKNWANLPEFSTVRGMQEYVGPPRDARCNPDVCGIYAVDVRGIGRLLRSMRICAASFTTAGAVAVWNMRHRYQLDTLMDEKKIVKTDISEILQIPCTGRAAKAFDVFSDPAPFRIARADAEFWEIVSKFRTKNGRA